MNRAIVLRRLSKDSPRLCVHWFVRDESGLIKTPEGFVANGMASGVRGRIACNPTQNSILPQERGMETFLCLNSDDVRAATCPKCLDTAEAKAMQEHYALQADLPNPQAAEVLKELFKFADDQSTVNASMGDFDKPFKSTAGKK